MTNFKQGKRVLVDACYLNDEVMKDAYASPTATILTEPQDNDELVCIQYQTGIIDYVPQYILDVIE